MIAFVVQVEVQSRWGLASREAGPRVGVRVEAGVQEHKGLEARLYPVVVNP